jgi:hypothetical protein
VDGNKGVHVMLPKTIFEQQKGNGRQAGASQ